MSDLMRNQFEEWQLQTYCGGSERLRKCKNDESYYYYTDVQLKWKAWQASRECLVIELPPEPEYPDEPDDAIDDSYMDEYHSSIGMRHACINFIHATGVKTK